MEDMVCIRPNGLSVNRFNTFKVIFGCLKCIRLKFGYPFFIVIILVCFLKEWYFFCTFTYNKSKLKYFLVKLSNWKLSCTFQKIQFLQCLYHKFEKHLLKSFSFTKRITFSVGGIYQITLVSKHN